MKSMGLAVLVSMSLLLHGCSDELAGQASKMVNTANAEEVYPRQVDPAQLARGGQLYQQHCAGCHGVNAEGAPGWHMPDAQGKNPPPPLNGTGHTWHHPLAALRHTISEGTAIIGGNMPGWKGALSEQDIDDVIAWFQVKWPEPLYQAWARNNARATRK